MGKEARDTVFLHPVKVKVKLFSCVCLFATPWSVASKVPPSMGFSRQEYWSGLPFPSPGDLPNSGIEPGFPALQADALTSEPEISHVLHMCTHVYMCTHVLLLLWCTA